MFLLKFPGIKFFLATHSNICPTKKKLKTKQNYLDMMPFSVPWCQYRLQNNAFFDMFETNGGGRGDLLLLVGIHCGHLQAITHSALVRRPPLQKACLTVEENLRLKSRLQVAEAEAEAGPRPASSAEQDYEEVIQLLEAEIKDLKNQLAGKRQARGLDATKVSKVSPS